MQDRVNAVTIESLAELREKLADALDLAIAAGADRQLLEKLAAAEGLLRALADVPNHSLVPLVVRRADRALEAWVDWKRARGPMAAA